MIIQLFNGGGQPDPEEYKTPKGMQGINVRLTSLNQQMIEKSRDAGKKIGIWIGKTDQKENQGIYDLLFGETGKRVDYFYSDFPVKAMKARDNIQGFN